ncbi:polysaccharide deacetylase family protein [Undibacter mobilis]|uniref:Chitooligosaccharide deacetylase n=1 Tax=Undibacter mobilis TaxID=2292256 RepID=A0A371B390_9BRAD|nr:polysaccharide deacetylase family protein [Undibacter mobilis]RDV01984.1 polysaccharide deacetylase [Undibacter mobilis]
MLKLPTHGRYGYSPIDERPTYQWPDGKRLAFYIGLNVEHFAFMAGIGNDPFSRTAGPQTQRNYAWRDYGLRVGIWKVFDLFEELGLPASILLNSLVCEHYPQVVERIKRRGDSICAHGRTNGELLNTMWEHDEARVIAETTDLIAAHFGRRPTGWMGPAAAESRVTPDLLVEAGYTHTLGWPLDDQPVWIGTRSGPILSVPYPMELNDIGSNVLRDHTGEHFERMIIDQFDEMLDQSEKHPLVMSIALHPFVCGQPFRLRALRRALKHCVVRAGNNVWFTDAETIAEYCMALPKGLIS